MMIEIVLIEKSAIFLVIYRFAEPSFDDSVSYLNNEIPPMGRNILNLGLKIQITNQAKDNSYASITIKK